MGLVKRPVNMEVEARLAAVALDMRAELVRRACTAYTDIIRSSRDLIQLKFELGRLVRLHLKWEEDQHDRAGL